MTTLNYLKTDRGYSLAYHYQAGHEPTVVFLHGYGSAMAGEKALAIENLCISNGQSFLRFDLSGHGESGGDFSQATIGQWRQDCLDAIEHIVSGTMILVGSSMGGWLMTLIALAIPSRIKACMGIAAAPDMTEYKLMNGLTEAQKLVLKSEGVIDLHSHSAETPLALYQKLLQSGKSYCVLESSILLNIPLTLVHARDDKDVPWQRSRALQDCWHGATCQFLLTPNGGHRLSDTESLNQLCDILLSIIMSHREKPHE